MKARARPESTTASEELSPEELAAIKAAGVWVHQFARTLKTRRLYDAANPTVVKFRQELGAALRQMLDEHGELELRFSADDVLSGETSLYPAKSRDDNLALPFFRDGIRTMTLSPGMRQGELDTLIEALMLVTGQNQETDDLVTLLWQAHLPHVNIEYVPSETDVGSGVGIESGGVPWPAGARPQAPELPGVAVEDAEAAEAEAAEAEEGEAGEDDTSRSDDCPLGQLTVEIESDFEEIEALAATEVKRFHSEFEAETQVPLVITALSVARACLGVELGPDQTTDFARYVPVVLRLAVEQGSWREANGAVGLLESGRNPDWTIETFVHDLLQQPSVAALAQRLQQQELDQVAEYVDFARRLGEHAADVLAHTLAEVDNPRYQRALSEAIVEVCRDNPELLAPWLSDRRWFVVKNTVQILGTIGGNQIAGMLAALVDHQDLRIRQELVGALRNVEPQHARPLLVRLLQGADSRMFCAVLGRLSQRRDPTVARLVLVYFGEAQFEQRPLEERHAILKALSGSGGDEVLPPLEAELYKGNWFSQGSDGVRQDVARCIAGIGTPLARLVLERGAESRRAAVRKACEAALGKVDPE